MPNSRKSRTIDTAIVVGQQPAVPQRPRRNPRGGQQGITGGRGRRAARSRPVTDQQRFEAVFAGLAAAGVAFWFDLRGATGAREDRYDDYIRAAERSGTDLWVGEHVGNTDTGGAYWGEDDGVLYGGRRPSREYPVRQLWWSFNHEYPQLAELLVHLFREQGIDASWTGVPYDSVSVNLAGVRAVEPTR